MHRSFDQPTASSTSRTGAREKNQQSSTRMRRAQYERFSTAQNLDQPIQPESVSARRKSHLKSDLKIPQQPSEQHPPPERKSPAYLQGKNPYGQFLDKVEHPYRGPRVEAGSKPPSLTANDTKGASDLIHSKSESALDRGQQTVGLPSELQVSSRQPPKLLSVQAKKDFFERKASQNQSTPMFPSPSLGGVAGHASIRKTPQKYQASSGNEKEKLQQAEIPPAPSQPDHKLLKQDTPEETRPAPQTETKPSVPNTPVEKFDMQPKLLVPESSQSDVGNSSTSTANNRRKLPTEFDASPGYAKVLEVKGHVTEATPKSSQASHPAPVSLAIKKTGQPGQRGSSEEIVRRYPVRGPTSAAEVAEAPSVERSSPYEQSRRSKFSRNVRGLVEEKQADSQHLRRRRSHSASLTKVGFPGHLTERTAGKVYGIDSDMYGGEENGGLLRNSHDALDIQTGPDRNPPAGLSHDGSSSTPSLSRRTTHEQVPASRISVQADYATFKVPDHVDWRGAYGRRKTQDFGFPGARIKPRRTYRTYKPLGDPDDWVRRSCGHFSRMGRSEARKQASHQPCKQCSIRESAPEIYLSKKRRTREWAATDFTNSSLPTPRDSTSDHGHHVRHRRHRSECMAPEKCGNAFAEDMGILIDAILDEHANSLQSVINNIERSRPILPQFRRVTENLVQRCPKGFTSQKGLHASCGIYCTHQPSSQHTCGLACQQMFQSVFQTQLCG